eukprot:s2522_g16.t1
MEAPDNPPPARRQSGSLIVGQRVVLVGDLVLAVNGQSHFEAVCNELRVEKALYFVVRRHAAALDLDLDAMRPAASSAVPAQSTADDLPPPPWAATAEMPAASSAVQSTEDDLRAPWAAAAQAPAASSTVPAQSTVDDSPAPWEVMAEAPAASSTVPAQSTAAPWEVMAEAPSKEETTLSTMASETDDPLSQQMLGWEQRAPGEWFHPSTQELPGTSTVDGQNPA